MVMLFSLQGLGSTWKSNVIILCSLSNMKMEDYEIFCRKHLSRIQEEAVKGETSLTVQNRNISLIQFYGVPVLSPLVRPFLPLFLPGVLIVLLTLALMCTYMILLKVSV